MTSSESIEWSQEAWTKRGIFMPCTRRHITVRKTSSDGEWVSGATGDYLGMRVPSIVTGQMLCDVVMGAGTACLRDVVGLILMKHG